MSLASIEEDGRLAREFSRMLNANPRRAAAPQSASQQSRSMETPVPKRSTCSKSHTPDFPITPISMISTPPEVRRNGFETSSSPLSSLHSSDESSSTDSSPLMMLRSSTPRHKLPEGKAVSLSQSFAVSFEYV